MILSYDHVHNIAKIPITRMLEYDLIILGSPTYGKGNLHYAWNDVLIEMQNLDFKERKFAVFCLGDQRFHEKSFAGAIERLSQPIASHSMKIIGKGWETNNTYSDTTHVLAAKSVLGLIVDDGNEKGQTLERIRLWCGKLKEDLEKKVSY